MERKNTVVGVVCAFTVACLVPLQSHAAWTFYSQVDNDYTQYIDDNGNTGISQQYSTRVSLGDLSPNPGWQWPMMPVFELDADDLNLSGGYPDTEAFRMFVTMDYMSISHAEWQDIAYALNRWDPIDELDCYPAFNQHIKDNLYAIFYYGNQVYLVDVEGLYVGDYFGNTNLWRISFNEEQTGDIRRAMVNYDGGTGTLKVKLFFASNPYHIKFSIMSTESGYSSYEPYFGWMRDWD